MNRFKPTWHSVGSLRQDEQRVCRPCGTAEVKQLMVVVLSRWYVLHYILSNHLINHSHLSTVDSRESRQPAYSISHTNDDIDEHQLFLGGYELIRLAAALIRATSPPTRCGAEAVVHGTLGVLDGATG